MHVITYKYYNNSVFTNKMNNIKIILRILILSLYI